MLPQRDKLHVRPRPVKEETVNGIIILATTKQEKTICDVISVGDKVKIVKENDIVYIEPKTGFDLGDGTLIISEHEIRATDRNNSTF